MHSDVPAPWLAYLEGESLSPADEAELAQALLEQPVLCAALNDDESLDCTLGMAAYAVESEATFLIAWEERVSSLAYCADMPPVVSPSIVTPSIVAPPIVPQSTAAPPLITLRPNRRIPRRKAWWPLWTAGCLALIALGAASLWHALSIDRGQAVNRPQRPVADRSPPVVPERPRQINPPVLSTVWKSGGPHDDRLPPGRHQLETGLARLVWYEGVDLEVTAPARLEVRDDGALLVHQGRVGVWDHGALPSRGIATPTASLTPRAAKFDLIVDDVGHTNLSLRHGELDLLPGRSPGRSPLRLVAGKLDRAHIATAATTSPDLSRGPLYCTLTGPGEQFYGQIDVGGEVLRFAAAQAFQEFRQQVDERFVASPEQLLREWPKLVRALGGVGGSRIAIEQEGARLELHTLDELLRIFNAPGGTNGQFQGSLNINGQEMKFDSLEEFEAARKKLLGPLKLFGDE